MKELLLVEDDNSLGELLVECLEEQGYRVRWVQTKAQAHTLAMSSGGNGFALVIIDIGLPDGSGLDLARDLRLSLDVPFMFLTAMSSAEYRLEGFELGAVDFIPKPFHLKELLLRVQALFDRLRGADLVLFKDFRVDMSGKAVIFPDGRKEYPIGRDFDILKLLIQNAPRAVSREQILARCWGGDREQTGRTVDNAVVRLRQLFKDSGNPIRSVRGIGYQWVQERE